MGRRQFWGPKAMAAIGTTVNRWYVAGFDHKRNGCYMMRVRCPHCLTIVVRYFGNLAKTKSCGCRERMKHGGAGWPEYKVWTAMKQRCLNPKDPAYGQYGGRGITVAKHWLRFDNFIADLGRRPSDNHTLERKNVNRGYVPGNVIWAPRAVQGLNRTTSRRITYRGETRTVGQWAKYINITMSGLRQRLARMSVEKALTMPVSGVGRRTQKVRFEPTESDWARVMRALRAAQTCHGPRAEGTCPVCAGEQGIHLPYCVVGRVLDEFGYRALLKRGLRPAAGAYGG